MPPKGWRKNGESTQIPKDAEFVSIDEILFPRLTIQKLAKGILAPAESGNSDNMSLAKDSLIAVQRAATVFVSHLMFHARKVAKDTGRKNVNSQDILQALERADLAGFLPEIKQKLSTFESGAEAKKKLRAEPRDSTANNDESEKGEPAAKKLKDNSRNTVAKSGENEENEDDENDAENIEDDDTTLPAANEEDAEADGDEEETVATNPIALLGQEEEELEGRGQGDTEVEKDENETEEED